MTMRATTARIPFYSEDEHRPRHLGVAWLRTLQRALAAWLNASARRRSWGWPTALSALLSGLAGAAVLAQRWPDLDGRAFRTAAATAGITFWIVIVFAVLIAEELRRLALRDREEEEARRSILPPEARGSAVPAPPDGASGDALPSFRTRGAADGGERPS
jgi:hypothetical protein